MTEVKIYGRAVHKFPLVVDDEQTIRIQKGAKVLAIQEQHGQPVLWAMVDLSAPMRDVQISTRGTGHSAFGVGEHLRHVPDARRHVRRARLPRGG